MLTSRQTYLLKERYFYGVSVDVGARRSPVQTTFYWFDQRASGGFIDRQSVGFEGRLLLPRFNAFTIVDYDVKYKELSLGLLTLNYNFPDNANLSLTADYRKSPLLTTTNGLIGQIFTLDFQPVTDLRDLKPFFTDAEIYHLAQDRTLDVEIAYGFLFAAFDWEAAIQLRFHPYQHRRYARHPGQLGDRGSAAAT